MTHTKPQPGDDYWRPIETVPHQTLVWLTTARFDVEVVGKWSRKECWFDEHSIELEFDPDYWKPRGNDD